MIDVIRYHQLLCGYYFLRCFRVVVNTAEWRKAPEYVNYCRFPRSLLTII